MALSITSRSTRVARAKITPVRSLKKIALSIPEALHVSVELNSVFGKSTPATAKKARISSFGNVGPLISKFDGEKALKPGRLAKRPTASAGAAGISITGPGRGEP